MLERTIAKPHPKTHILIKNARTHNLRGVDLALPRGKLIVVTGLSGSGKSSLAFDTLYAEGQRRYVESLSAYARQFLGKMDKPDVESIRGISPAIAIEQKNATGNARSTVGTTTEIYDYLRLLFARIGKTVSPVSGEEVKRESTDDVVNFIRTLPDSTAFLILAPMPHIGKSPEEKLDMLLKQGYARVKIDGETTRIEDALENLPKKIRKLDIVVDRVRQEADDQDNESRIADSVETAFFESDGTVAIEVLEGDRKGVYEFSNRFEKDGMTFEIPDEHFFSFNSPVGACKTCDGYGSVIGIDPDAVFPDHKLSVFEDAVAPWRGHKMSKWKNALVAVAEKFDFPIHRPYKDLSEDQKELLWTGNRHFKGLNAFFKYVESKSYKIQYRVMLSRYRGKTRCPDCKGTRIRKDATYVKVGGVSIVDLLSMPTQRALDTVRSFELTENERAIAKRLLTEITNRLDYLVRVGLSYLTLDRLSNSLSGGEAQRIKLATCLGSSLIGSMYILDEPSIGLHPKDTERLIGILRSLQQAGNTVIVVEHDEEIMRAADHIVDMGPGAGSLGGRVVFEGNHDDLLLAENSLTAEYLTGKRRIEVPAKRRPHRNKITVKGARENNLKNLDVDFPLNCLVAVTGVSGSGKSTLVTDILYPALKKRMDGYAGHVGLHDEITGDLKMIRNVEFVDQNPIGKSSRSNPVTYVKAFDEIRRLFSSIKMSKVRGYTPGHFSFNVKGGRCDTCEGEGVVRIGMQFMADITLTCETCGGTRYKAEILEVKYRGKNIADVLEMTVDDAVDFFNDPEFRSETENIASKLLPLQKVGMGYVKLGQSSETLSGGEAQRTKLAAFLARGEREPDTLFIFDEPTTGLHFHDVAKLLGSFGELINKGHSVVVIEHDPDVIKMADHIIDLGPVGGVEGGYVVFEGTPEALIENKESATAPYIRAKLKG